MKFVDTIKKWKKTTKVFVLAELLIFFVAAPIGLVYNNTVGVALDIIIIALYALWLFVWNPDKRKIMEK